MSLASNIKEFADLLHNIYAQQLSSLEGTDITSDGVLSLAIPKAVVLQQACLYAAKSFSSGVFYFLTFQWLRDFSYFPLLSPEVGNRASMFHDTFLSEPFSYLFSFAKNGVSLSPHAQLQSSVISEALQEGAGLTNKSFVNTSPLMTGIQEDLHSQQGFTTIFNGFLKGDHLLAGFVNSFFFSLPFSLPHLITLRRMFSQGAAAAAASILGTVAAHSLAVVGVLYGIRLLIVPYHSLQPLTYLIGVVTVAIVITEFVKEKRVYLVPLMHYPSLVRIGVLNFVLALCESATVFHELQHLTLNQQVTSLQLYEYRNTLDSFFSHTAYLIAFVLGHVLFSLGFCFLVLKLNERLCSLTGWTIPQTARRINQTLLVSILALTLSCFPYYGLDYLFTKGAGFLPEDPAYRNTVFSPTQVRSRNRHFKSKAPTTKDSRTPLELDVSYFDRGMYLAAPKEEKTTNDLDFAENSASSETAAAYDPVLTFEELNYQGESAWLMRHERARRLPEEQDSKKESVFQKPKTHFKQLRLNQDNKQAEAALKELPQIGPLSEWKEGIRPGERVSFYDQEGEKSLTGRSDASPRFGLGGKNPLKLFAQDDKVEPHKKSLFENDATKHLVREPFSSEKSQDKRLLLKELAFEKEVASSYEKSFASPFGEESDGTPPDLLPVENIIKKRYRLNPVYRALLQTDIDFFIARQPTDYRITQNQEASLFKKRQLLEKYYNSIRYYSPVEGVGFTKRYFAGSNDHAPQSISNKPSREADQSFLQNTPRRDLLFTKSFIETMYHQQFNGTLNTVKRFFKLTFDEQQNPAKNRILSYDQLLYKKRNSFLSLQKESDKGLQSRALDERQDPSLHEELVLEQVSPFIEESNSAPVYAGWDDRARRFVVTNRFNFLQSS